MTKMHPELKTWLSENDITKADDINLVHELSRAARSVELVIFDDAVSAILDELDFDSLSRHSFVQDLVANVSKDKPLTDPLAFVYGANDRTATLSDGRVVVVK